MTSRQTPQFDRSFVLPAVALCLSLAFGCSSSTPSGNGEKGGASLGGASASGGRVGTGGSSAAGGTSGMAGQSGSAGQTAAGGAKGSGGAIGSGGASAMGGAAGAGGAARAGGTTGQGGLNGSGGTAGAGGATGAGGGTAVAGAIYVSPSGDDSNPGTLDKPLKTVAKARDMVRTKNSAMTADQLVYLRGGTYPLTEAVTFANADSGKDGHYVKYMAYPDEQPLVTGGKRITGWKVSDTAKNIYSADAGTTPFRQLYVNGVKAVRARTPNQGVNGGINFASTKDVDSTAHTILMDSSAVSNWKNFTKVEMHMMVGWAGTILRLASFTTSGATASVKFQPDEDAILFIRPNPSVNRDTKTRNYFFENALEFLDSPGEWYLDETSNTLYYMPRTSEDMSTVVVVAPMVETLVSVKGTSTTDQAAYLWFQGLTFAHSTYMRPSQHGYVDAQAGQYNITADANNNQTIGRPGAGVTVTNANHIQFERNLFTQMAATGLDLISGTHDNAIIGNVFTDIGGSGISVGKFTANETTEYHIPYNPTDANEICTNDTVKDNYVHDVTTEIQGGCGIVGGYPRGIHIEHNEVAYVNYSGISVGYGWTGAANAMSNNIIQYNDVHHVTQILADGSSIYTLSNQGPASKIEYNYVHDFGQSKWADFCCVHGLYLDEGSTGFSVAHNLLSNSPTDVFQNRNGSNTVDDNSGNPSGAANTKATAGIEPAYADIKTRTAPIPTF